MVTIPSQRLMLNWQKAMTGTDEGPLVLCQQGTEPSASCRKEEGSIVFTAASKTQPPAFAPHHPDVMPSVTSLAVRGGSTEMEGNTVGCASSQTFLTADFSTILPDSAHWDLMVIIPTTSNKEREGDNFFLKLLRGPGVGYRDSMFPGQLWPIEMHSPSIGSMVS